MLYFQLCLKTFPLLFNDNPQVPSGGPCEKVIQVLLRRKVKLCYDTNRFLNSCMFFEIFRQQNSNFMEKNLENIAFFGLNFPPWCSMQVCIRNQTNATASSFIPRFNCTQSKGKFLMTISNFAQALATFVLNAGYILISTHSIPTLTGMSTCFL